MIEDRAAPVRAIRIISRDSARVAVFLFIFPPPNSPSRGFFVLARSIKASFHFSTLARDKSFFEFNFFLRMLYGYIEKIYTFSRVSGDKDIFKNTNGSFFLLIESRDSLFRVKKKKKKGSLRFFSLDESFETHMQKSKFAFSRRAVFLAGLVLSAT